MFYVNDGSAMLLKTNLQVQKERKSECVCECGDTTFFSPVILESESCCHSLCCPRSSGGSLQAQPALCLHVCRAGRHPPTITSLPSPRALCPSHSAQRCSNVPCLQNKMQETKARLRPHRAPRAASFSRQAVEHTGATSSGRPQAIAASQPGGAPTPRLHPVRCPGNLFRHLWPRIRPGAGKTVPLGGSP